MKRQSQPANLLRLAFCCSAILFAVMPGCVNTETRTAYKPYVLDEGMWCGNFETGYVETRAATVAALATLQMPVVAEGRIHRGSFLDTQTPDGLHVRVHLRSQAHRGPGNGDVTHVAVRVGGFGSHEKVCTMLLDEIGRHIGPATALMPPPPANAGPPQGANPIAPVSASSQQAPALPPQPAPVQK